jgi:hypothetical protein
VTDWALIGAQSKASSIDFPVIIAEVNVEANASPAPVISYGVCG